MAEERWMPVPGFDGYDVSDHGRVRSWRMYGKHSHMRRTSPRILKPKMSRSEIAIGRPRHRVVLACNGHLRTVLVHRLVMAAFVGPCPDGMEVCHNNGNSTDNRLDNLRYDTHLNNLADRELHGTMIRGDRHPARIDPSYFARGSEHPSSKFTDEDVIFIRTSTLSRKDLASMFSVHVGTISCIRSGKEWKHVEAIAPKPKNCVKLTQDDADKIRELYAQGVRKATLSRQFGVGYSSITRIIDGETWNGVDLRTRDQRAERGRRTRKAA